MVGLVVLLAQHGVRRVQVVAMHLVDNGVAAVQRMDEMIVGVLDIGYFARRPERVLDGWVVVGRPVR